MPREITVGEFTAEALEAEAAAMPTSDKVKADALRVAAKIYRERGNTKKIRVWEEDEWEDRRADFIRPDPASQG